MSGQSGETGASVALSLREVFAQALQDTGRWPFDVRQRQVSAHILRCRTPASGGVLVRCLHCEHEPIRYHSCRDRHCPQCQGRASAAWAERQPAHTLPAPYHHGVFTVPEALNDWGSLHPKAIYAQMFRNAWATLSAFFAGHRRLRGRGAMTAILHTWDQTLRRPVHRHCLVPAGALDEEGQWHMHHGEYLFAVRALSRRWRGHFVAGLRQCADDGELAGISEVKADAILEPLMSTEWVVYSKGCVDHTPPKW